MARRCVVRAVLSASILVSALASATPAAAATTVDGKLWRSMRETTGVTWKQLAAICPKNGVGRCSGSIGGRNLTGWVWATESQVIQLMGRYEPAILTANPPSITGPEYVVQAIGFVDAIGSTFFFSGYPTTVATLSGWTSTKRNTVPIAAGAGYEHPIFSGSFWAAPGGAANVASQYRGAWLWRPATDDLTPPVIQPNVSGTPASAGWHISDVSVAWDVQDPESPVSSQSGCGPATVTTDTPGTTFTCTATSAGGTATASTVVKRDTTHPVVTCASPPEVFQIYQFAAWVSATVTDATSGPERAVAQAAANTNAAGTFTTRVTGADRAGLRTTATCAYRVVVPTCRDLTPTIVGNGQNNVINGTAGVDVIVGLGGADTIYGNGGNDVICGGDGPDMIDGGPGNDWINGEASPDDLHGGSGDDFIDGGLHLDSIRGDDGRDTCVSGEQRMSSCEP